ncbi:MAG TPA: GAP family protein [Thermomicrobiales bacterium]|nr:GAP family protein [Thermomicrobiales bacterium]
MWSVVGDYLGPAIGIALSPMAIVGFILMLVSAGGMAKAWGFIGGWAAGTGIVLVLVGLLVSGSSDSDADTTSSVMGWIKILFGLGMIFLAWRQWQGRPKEGEAAVLPTWMQAMDSVTPVKAVGLGAFLAAVNPKNLPLLITSASIIGQANLSGAEHVASYLIFIVLATLGMLVPMVISMAMGEKGARILDDVREWMVANNATIMAVLFLVLGVSILGKGIESF